MKGIKIKDGFVFYYGNPAGYTDGEAAVLDSIFKSDELEGWIRRRGFAPQWSEGVYDRLADGGPAQSGKAPLPLKSCRIWQLKPDTDIMMKFISYEEMTAKFGEPDPADYTLVYDGQIGTNELEAIWMRLNHDSRPPGYIGYALSISDVIELYDHTGSEFHYVDRSGFQKISFEGQMPEETQIMAAGHMKLTGDFEGGTGTNTPAMRM
jgi:hypothetical protein